VIREQGRESRRCGDFIACKGRFVLLPYETLQKSKASFVHQKFKST
jgi:hypothetical protein